MPGFKRLLRFESSDGKTYYGEAPESSTGPELVGTKVPVYDDPLIHKRHYRPLRERSSRFSPQSLEHRTFMGLA